MTTTVNDDQFVVLTGLSGAGRSLAADHMEDLGWPVVGNLPPALVPHLADLVHPHGTGPRRVAMAVGTNSADELTPALTELRQRTTGVRVLFLEARTDTLVRRFQATRRRHPLDEHGGLNAAIGKERELLSPVRAGADVVVDTTELNRHTLRSRISSLFGGPEQATGMCTTLVSFGYKHGIPPDADLVLDCRFLPNPHWIEHLRPHTGLHPAVSDWVLGQPAAPPFVDNLEAMLAHLLPAYAAEGRSYLTVALGCTGGRHRSVAMTERVATALRGAGFTSTVLHRDVHREGGR